AGAVAPVGKARQYHLAGTRTPRRQLVETGPCHIEPAQPQERVAPPCPVIDAVAHRLAVLAVARHVDAEFALAAHDLAHRRSEPLLDGAVVVGLAGPPRPVSLH